MYAFQEKDLLECEFYVLEALQFDLILHHPFSTLLQYVISLFRFSRPNIYLRFLDEFDLQEECLHVSWSVDNDI